jgi:putative acetyltransferase
MVPKSCRPFGQDFSDNITRKIKESRARRNLNASRSSVSSDNGDRENTRRRGGCFGCLLARRRTEMPRSKLEPARPATVKPAPKESAPGKLRVKTPAGLAIRAREPGDWREVAAIMDLPNVRWGTLRLPFTSQDYWRKMLEQPPDGMTGIVAVLDGRIVGLADVTPYKGRRSHVGLIGISVHDDYHGRGIGSALVAALVDVSDNWLDLKRLELTVYVDNERAIRLYRAFGFEVEGTRRADAFRDGKYVDSLMMARLKSARHAPPA